jgi:hypothetical protein
MIPFQEAFDKFIEKRNKLWGHKQSSTFNVCKLFYEVMEEAVKDGRDNRPTSCRV